MNFQGLSDDPRNRVARIEGLIRVLEDHLRFLSESFQFLLAQGEHVFSFEANRPFYLFFDQPQERPSRGCLSAPAFAHQRKNFTFFKG